MTDDQLTGGSDEQVEAAFIRELDGVADRTARRALEDDYARRYPGLKDRLRELAAVQEQVWKAQPPDPDLPQHQLAPGSRLGEFEVVRLIGVGGMGEVYEARQARLDRSVALKVIRRGRAESHQRARFDTESKTLARLHQTHIVPIHAAGEEGGVQYFAMAYIGGAPLSRVVESAYAHATTASRSTPSLRELAAVQAEAAPGAADAEQNTALYRPAPPPPRDPRARFRLPMRYLRSVADVVAQAADAVQYAHEARICHRDIKPSNLMVDRDGHCWIIDFGLAGHLAGGPAMSDAAPVGHTGGAKGTPQYMAPEQYDGKADRRSDVWGLGVTLYELLTLRRAFDGPSAQAVEEAVRAASPRPPRELVPSIPQDLAAVCRLALRKDPADRYATAGELAADLRRWLRHEPTQARGAWPVRRALLWGRRNPGWSMAFACLFLLGWVAWGYQRAEDERRTTEERRKNEEGIAEERRKSTELQRRMFDQARRDFQDAVRVMPQHAGWSRGVDERLRTMLRLRSDADLRDERTSTLAGLDATPIYEHRLPPPKRKSDHFGVSVVSFSPDSSRLLAAGWGQRGTPLSQALLWDGNRANKPTAVARPGYGPVAFPDADSPLQLLLTGTEVDGLTLWNLGSDKAVAKLPLPERGTVRNAALSPNGRFAAAVFVARRTNGAKQPPEPVVLLWEIDRRPSGTPRKIAKWRGDPSALAFSGDGKAFASGDHDGEVVVRSTADGTVTLRLSEGELVIESLAFGRNFRRPSGARPPPTGPADGWTLAVGSKGGRLSVWDLRTRDRVNRYYGSEFGAFAAAFSPDGTTLAAAGRGFPLLWDVATGRPLLRIQDREGGFPAWTEGVAFSPDGRRLAFGSAPVFNIGGIHVFRLDDGRGVRSYRGLTSVPEKVWLSPSGKWLAALAQNWQLGVWDRRSGQVAFVWDVPAGITADNSALTFDAGDSQVVFSSGRRAVRWALATGQPTGLWELPPGLNDCLASRPGQKPLLVRRDFVRPRPVVRARELGPNGQARELYTIPELEVKDLTLSTDGAVLLVNEERPKGRCVRLYRGWTGKEITLDPALLPPDFDYGRLTDSGAVLALRVTLEEGRRTHLFRLPGLKRHGVHPGDALQADDVGKLVLSTSPPHPDRSGDLGLSLYRVGETQPLLTFDPARSTIGSGIGLSTDGRIFYWGRGDGTVCVADVNDCLGQLAPFGKP